MLKNVVENLRDFDQSEKVLFLTQTLSGIQNVTFLTEIGLYKLLGRSRKPIAHTFQKWMINTIKEIRINGFYKLKEENEVDKQLIIQNYDLMTHKNLIKAYDQKNVIYLCRLKYLDDKKIVKIGSTQNIKERMSHMNGQFENIEIVLIDIIEINNYRKFEKYLHNNDYIKNYSNGYLANRLIYLDVLNKEYQLIDYDHVTNYEKQYHTSGDGKKASPIFSKDTFRNAATSISFYPKNPKLFDGVSDNISEKMGEIYGNRLSSMIDLTNIKMNITIPGRTDIEAGRMLYFEYPALGAREQGDTSDDMQDKQYSGYYLITAIHHKVNKLEHMMTCEIVKDSLDIDKNTSST